MFVTVRVGSICILAGLCWAGVSSSAAQLASTIGPGTLVRITVPGRLRGSMIMTVIAVGSDSLSGSGGWSLSTVAGGTKSFQVRHAFGISEIGTLEMSTGHHSNGLRGMLIGAGTGALSGGVIGFAMKDPDWGRFTGPGATLGLAVGAAVGGFIGMATRTDHWAPVALPESPHRFGIAPLIRSRSLGIAAAVPF